MKYLKHFYVDPITDVAISYKGIWVNGQTLPRIEGLTVHFYIHNPQINMDVMYSTVEDDEVNTNHSAVTNMTELSWFNDVEADFNRIKNQRILETFEYVKGIKAMVIDKWWHHSEITAAMTRKNEEAFLAVQAVDDTAAASAAPFIALEANARHMSVKELAQRILDNHDGLIAAEAIVSGHRGLITDMIDAITFDRTDVESAKQSFTDLYMVDITQGFDVILGQLGL